MQLFDREPCLPRRGRAGAQQSAYSSAPCDHLTEPLAAEAARDEDVDSMIAVNLWTAEQRQQASVQPANADCSGPHGNWPACRDDERRNGSRGVLLDAWAAEVSSAAINGAKGNAEPLGRMSPSSARMQERGRDPDAHARASRDATRNSTRNSARGGAPSRRAPVGKAPVSTTSWCRRAVVYASRALSPSRRVGASKRVGSRAGGCSRAGGLQPGRERGDPRGWTR